nr:MAG TPA: hypothetical protein [Caudoviricetes sp.]
MASIKITKTRTIRGNRNGTRGGRRPTNSRPTRRKKR